MTAMLTSRGARAIQWYLGAAMAMWVAAQDGVGSGGDVGRGAAVALIYNVHHSMDATAAPLRICRATMIDRGATVLLWDHRGSVIVQCTNGAIDPSKEE